MGRVENLDVVGFDVFQRVDDQALQFADIHALIGASKLG
jgi:hypothetical protein